MKLLLTILLASMAMPVLAQHSGHPMPGSSPSPVSGEAGVRSAPAADPHAGHQMPLPSKEGAQSDPHAGHDMGPTRARSAAPAQGSPPDAAYEGPKHAADLLFDPKAMERAREQLRAEQGATRPYRVLIDRLEARLHGEQDQYLWDAQGWYGSDIDKLWLKAEGEGAFSDKVESVEAQILWSHAITPWFDLQGGLRYDFRPKPDRGYLVLGAQGLAPYFFELDAAAFVSEKGDISARLEAEYDLLITQRLILQPRAEVNLAVQQVRALGIGRGFNDIELGVRLRYEFAREFAPYIGVEWERKLGRSADFARDEGDSVDNVFFVAGLRIWF